MRTHKQIAAGQRRTLMAIKEKLIVLTAQWWDEDFFFERRLEELVDHVQKVCDELVVPE